MTKYVNQAVNAIIRPPRQAYDLREVPQFLTGDDGQTYIRHPFTIENERSQNLQVSIYHSMSMALNQGGPCLIYLHGNASSQLEGQFLVPNFCPYNVFVCTFDFAGCGCSDGDYVSLGYFESQDCLFLLNFLQTNFSFFPFAIWGRSMGAATTLLVDHQSIHAKVSDSSFTSVPDMCKSISDSLSLPSMFNSLVIWFLKNQVIKTAGFDFDSKSPLASKNDNFPPIVFGHANDDQFIPFEHCRKLYDNYPNKFKYLMSLEGGHNGRRGIDWLTLAIGATLESLGFKTDKLVVSECRKLQKSNAHFSNLNSMLVENENRKVDSLDLSEIIDKFDDGVIPKDAQVKNHKHKHPKKDKKLRSKYVDDNESDVSDLIDEKNETEKSGGFEKKETSQRKSSHEKKKMFQKRDLLKSRFVWKIKIKKLKKERRSIMEEIEIRKC